MLEKHKEIVLPVLEKRGGKLIKTIGDAFLMVFESPTDAVLSGVEVQDALLEYNHGKTGDDRLDVRIAINVGEVNLTDDDVFGEPVNITARIEAIAEAGEVYFSEAVYLAMNKREVPTSEIGFRKLKGIADEIKLYKVKREVPVEDLPPADHDEPATASSPPPPPEKPGVYAQPAISGTTPGLFRRFGALAVDFVICMLVFGIFIDTKNDGMSKSDEYRMKKEIRSGIKKSMEKHGVQVEIKDDKVTLGGVEISEKGIQGKNLDVSDKGLKFKGDIEISEDRIKIGDAIDIRTDKKAGKDEPAPDAAPAEKLAAAAKDVEHAAGDIEDAVREVEDAVEDAVETSIDDTVERAIGSRHRGGKKKNKRAFPFLWAIYGTFFLTIWGATPGKRVLGLRVVSMETPANSPLHWKTAALRSIVSVFSASFLLIGYIWGAFTKDQRTWHDLIAKTRVVRD
jgi:hypothetical protein